MNQSAAEFNTAHIFRLTDDTGMFQHTRYNVPDLSKGYTTDDNARALIMVVMLYEKTGRQEYLDLVYRYMAFIMHSQTEDGYFRNFMTYERKFTEVRGSAECFGRCLWAMGYALISTALPEGVRDACASAIKLSLPRVAELKDLRGQAYALIGLGFITGEESMGLIIKLADAIAVRFEQCATSEDWCWFEDSLTYDNALLPWSMFAAYQKTGQERFLDIALKSIAFFDQNAFRDGFFRPVGCNGWWLRGEATALFDQQPIEASMSTLAHLVAYEVTGDETMLRFARRSLAWYAGENSCHKSMIDPATGGCYDGIMAEGLNLNQGAESIVGYCIASMAMGTMAETVEADTVYRPWGFFTVLGAALGYKMKRIVVNPGQVLSLQMHYHRSEYWIVISGMAKVTVAENEFILNENETVFIPKTIKHRLENTANLPLEIIEVQNGGYLGEDDIVRFADKYGRVDKIATGMTAP